MILVSEIGAARSVEHALTNDRLAHEQIPLLLSVRLTNEVAILYD